MKKLTENWNITDSGDGENNDKLTKEHHFISLITPNVVGNEGCMKDVRKAVKLGCPMYAIIKEGTVLDAELKAVNWLAVAHFKDEKDMDKAVAYIKLQVTLNK